jgi:hypothetical protein
MNTEHDFIYGSYKIIDAHQRISFNFNVVIPQADVNTQNWSAIFDLTDDLRMNIYNISIKLHSGSWICMHPSVDMLEEILLTHGSQLILKEL